MRHSIGFLRRTQGVAADYDIRLHAAVEQCKQAARQDNIHNSRCISHVQPGRMLVTSFVLASIPKVTDSVMGEWQQIVRRQFPELRHPIKIQQRNQDTWDFEFETPSNVNKRRLMFDHIKVIALCIVLLLLNAWSWCHNYPEWTNSHYNNLCL